MQVAARMAAMDKRAGITEETARNRPEWPKFGRTILKTGISRQAIP